MDFPAHSVRLVGGLLALLLAFWLGIYALQIWDSYKQRPGYYRRWGRWSWKRKS